MEVLESYPKLEGKTIAFTHMAQFAEQITIATTDGCILMAKFGYDEDNEDCDGDNPEIRVLGKHRVLYILESDGGRYIREELAKKGLFDLVAFKKREKIKQERELAEWRVKQEAKEKQEYERLKAKFESDATKI